MTYKTIEELKAELDAAYAAYYDATAPPATAAHLPAAAAAAAACAARAGDPALAAAAAAASEAVDRAFDAYRAALRAHENSDD